MASQHQNELADACHTEGNFTAIFYKNMNFRSLFLQSLALSLTLVLRAETASAGQPVDAALPTGDEATSVQSASTSALTPELVQAFAKKYTIARPLDLREEFGVFPEKPVEQVRLFESMGAFQQFLKREGNPVVMSIGDFKNYVKPEDADKFREALHAFAAKSGADYLVLVTEKKELALNFRPERGCPVPLVYGALAYKRAEARLGINPSKEAGIDQLKIGGFMPKSRAEKSGLRVGDVIKKIEGFEPDRAGYWQKALRWKAGEKVKVEVERDGKIMEFEVELIAG
jgi:hypothetical protein